ncbi:hypothetical protein BW730_00315 [Tessaracoccus aquimaris]|uniref:Uncharacterized protein n=1 Tax=Tessaracoccus aquimaris TaxID=1332264 RepID=A0A1Q2CSL1_9ACTN|nr:hypothetical protein [Tessaracoccus aquimaris]AQP49109.1 hypothetical protein BW730_00315 [Tessaracoccus aquimaris]
MRERLRRTYLNLGTGELTATAVFVIGAVFAVQPKLIGTEQIALWAALGPLVLILLQAGCYWLLARGWLLERPAPQPVVSLYRVLRILDPIALLAGLILIVAFWPARIGVAILVVAIWLFGLVEYVNYYVVRLSYPLARWFTEVGAWRTPRLVIDLFGERVSPSSSDRRSPRG